jgi:hypothetical protein
MTETTMGSVAGALDHVKLLTLGTAYGVVSLLVAGLVATAVPESYLLAVLVGWIGAVVIVARLLRARYLG